MGWKAAVAGARLVFLASLDDAIARWHLSSEIRDEIHFWVCKLRRLHHVQRDADPLLLRLPVDGWLETRARRHSWTVVAGNASFDRPMDSTKWTKQICLSLFRKFHWSGNRLSGLWVHHQSELMGVGLPCLWDLRHRLVHFVALLCKFWDFPLSKTSSWIHIIERFLIHLNVTHAFIPRRRSTFSNLWALRSCEVTTRRGKSRGSRFSSHELCGSMPLHNGEEFGDFSRC